jgi:hypothetical protein
MRRPDGTLLCGKAPSILKRVPLSVTCTRCRKLLDHLGDRMVLETDDKVFNSLVEEKLAAWST